MGTVMGWVDKKGVRHQTLVLDASYRGNKQWAGSLYNVAKLPYYTGQYNLNAINGTNGPNDWLCAKTYDLFGGKNMTDDLLNNYSGYFEDQYTSKQNTNLILEHSSLNTTSYAAGWCRSKLVSHNNIVYGCDLPNIQTLVRICCSQFKLDEMDGYTGIHSFKFTAAGSGKQYNWCVGNPATWCSWSSTQWSSDKAYFIDDCYMVYGWSKTYNGMGSIPVLELDSL